MGSQLGFLIGTGRERFVARDLVGTGGGFRVAPRYGLKLMKMEGSQRLQSFGTQYMLRLQVYLSVIVCAQL
jgi:hypothetical protein